MTMAAPADQKFAMTSVAVVPPVWKSPSAATCCAPNTCEADAIDRAGTPSRRRS